MRRLIASLLPSLPSARRVPRATVAGVVCVATAMLLWTVLTLRKTHTARVTAPLEVTSVAPGRGLVEAPPPRVSVTVEGTGFRLLSFIARPPTLRLAAQRDSVPLRTALAALGSGLRVVDAAPATLNLSTAPLVTRRVPVVLRGAPAFAPTFDLSDSIRLLPESLTVTAAAPVVQGLRAWPTDRLDLTGLRDTARLTLALADTLAGLASVPTRLVRVTVPVSAYTGAERDVEVRVRGVPPGAARLTPDPPTLRVRFRVRLGQYEAAMRALDFYADVHYDDLVASPSGRVFPRLRLPAGLAVRDLVVTPQTVGYYTVVE